MSKCEYVIKEVNQPSGKALRQYHEHVVESMSQTFQGEAELDLSLPKVHDSTLDRHET